MDGRFRLVVSRDGKGNRYRLFELAADRGETHDIVAEYPDKARHGPSTQRAATVGREQLDRR